MTNDRARATDAALAEIASQPGHTPLMRQYFKYRQEAGCILAYQMGDFFEFFYEDARIVSDLLDIFLNKRGCAPDGTPVPMCGVPADARFCGAGEGALQFLGSSGHYFNRIVEAGHPLALAVYTGQADETGLKTRELVYYRDISGKPNPGASTGFGRSGTRPVSEMYDAALRAEALTRAAEGLAFSHTDLTDAGSPPILQLLEMAIGELKELGASLSELERVEEKGQR